MYKILTYNKAGLELKSRFKPTTSPINIYSEKHCLKGMKQF